VILRMKDMRFMTLDDRRIVDHFAKLLDKETDRGAGAKSRPDNDEHENTGDRIPLKDQINIQTTL